MKAANEDPYDIKKFQEVLGESYMMIPDSTARLKQSLEDLASYVASGEVAEECKGSEWYAKAMDVLERGRSRWDDNNASVEETRLDDLKDGEVF